MDPVGSNAEGATPDKICNNIGALGDKNDSPLTVKLALLLSW